MPRKNFAGTSSIYATVIILMVLITAPISALAANTNIFIVGDSTACNYDSNLYPRMGWGQVLNRLFDSGVTVHNYAISGRSSKSYWDEGSFAAFAGEIRQGDFLFIQFGHNDEKSEDATRYTEPWSTYQAYLLRYINQCRQRGGIPVLLTPVNRRSFNSNGTLRETHGEYPAAMIALGHEENVPVIDITRKSKVLFEAYGVEGTKELFLILSAGESRNYPYGVEDNTHFQERGAVAVSKLVLEGIEENDLFDSDPGGQTCRSWTATNEQHVSAGRAYTTSNSGCDTTTTYFAAGSDENLGNSGSTTTTLYTNDNGATYYSGSCSSTSTDADADGYYSDVDCNDGNAGIHPGATEICGDGIDQNCDGTDLACQACRAWTATNDAHVSAGRAYTESSSSCDTTTTYYAVGSQEDLGISGNTTTTLITQDGGQSYVQGDCSTTPTPPPGTNTSVTLEAEDATIGNGVVESEHTGFSGGGYVNFANETGSYVQWTVNTGSAGNCDVTFRFANGSSTSRPMDILANGSTRISSQRFDGTGAWTIWAEITVSIYLNSGSNTIRAVSTGADGGPNVDRIVVAGDVIQ